MASSRIGSSGVGILTMITNRHTIDARPMSTVRLSGLGTSDERTTRRRVMPNSANKGPLEEDAPK